MLSEEVFGNASVLTAERPAGAELPSSGLVGDHSGLDGASGQGPRRPQRISQVVVRKRSGKLELFCDGRLCERAVLDEYCGERVSRSVKKHSDGSLERWSAVRGFLDERSGERSIGGCGIAVVAEEGQSLPDGVEVRVWQQKTSAGSDLPPMLTNSVELNPTPLTGPEVNLLVLPFPCRYFHPPYVEIRDGSAVRRKNAAKYKTVYAKTFLFALSELALYAGSAYFGIQNPGFLYSWFTTASILPNVDSTRYAALRASGVAAATILGYSNIATILATLSAQGLWFLFTRAPEGTTPAVFEQPPLSGSSEQRGTPFNPQDFAEGKIDSLTKVTAGLANWKESVPTKAPRTRFTIAQLAESLEKLSDANGKAVGPREKLLGQFLSTPSSNSFWAFIVTNWGKVRTDSDEDEAVKAARDKEPFADSDDVILPIGLDLATLQLDRTETWYEIVVTDFAIRGQPTSFWVQAGDVGIRAAWEASGIGNDIERLRRAMSTFSPRLMRDDVSSYPILGSDLTLPIRTIKALMPGQFAKWMAGIQEGSRTTLAAGVKKLIPMADGKLHELRKKVESAARLEDAAVGGVAMRVLPQVASVKFASARLLPHDASGSTLVGDDAVRTSPGVEEAIRIGSRAVARQAIATQPLFEKWEESTSTRATVFFFVESQADLGNSALQPVRERLCSFSPVPSVVPYEILEAEKRFSPSADHERFSGLITSGTSLTGIEETALADEILHRLVHRRDSCLPWEGAQRDTKDQSDHVAKTLAVCEHVSSSDIVFDCLRGGRGAFVVLRAAQEWGCEDVLVSTREVGVKPRKKQVRELASAYKKVCLLKHNEVAKLQVQALQNMVATRGGPSAEVALRLSESVSSFLRVTRFAEELGLDAFQDLAVRVATVAMRPTLISLRGPYLQDGRANFQLQAIFRDRIRVVDEVVLGPAPAPTFAGIPERTASLWIPNFNEGAPNLFLVPYSHWLGHLTPPRSKRTIESIPVWTSYLLDSIITMQSAPDHDASISETLEGSPYVIRISSAKAEVRFARCFRENVNEEAFRETPFSQLSNSRTVADTGAPLVPAQTTWSDIGWGILDAVIDTPVRPSSLLRSRPAVGEEYQGPERNADWAGPPLEPERPTADWAGPPVEVPTVPQQVAEWISSVRISLPASPFTSRRQRIIAAYEGRPDLRALPPSPLPPDPRRGRRWESRGVDVGFEQRGGFFFSGVPDWWSSLGAWRTFGAPVRALAVPETPEPAGQPGAVGGLPSEQDGVPGEGPGEDDKPASSGGADGAGPSSDEGGGGPGKADGGPSEDGSDNAGGGPKPRDDPRWTWWDDPEKMRALNLGLSWLLLKKVPNPYQLAVPVFGRVRRVAVRVDEDEEETRDEGELGASETRDVTSPAPKVFRETVDDILYSVESLLVYGTSGRLSHRAGVILWNTERIVQAVLLLRGTWPEDVERTFDGKEAKFEDQPFASCVLVEQPLPVRAARVVPSAAARARIRQRLVFKMRRAVTEHFGELKQSFPSDELVAGETGTTFSNKNRPDGRQLPDDHWDNPVANNDAEIVQYARDRDRWAGEMRVVADDTELRTLLRIYDSPAEMDALARKFDQPTKVQQEQLRRRAEKMTRVSRDAFTCSVALAGAVLRCIIETPILKVADPVEEEDDEDTIDDLPERTEIAEHNRIWFEKTRKQNEKLAAEEKAAVEEILKNSGLSFEEPEEDTLPPGDGSEVRGDTEFVENRQVGREYEEELETEETDVLERLKTACQESPGALSLGELALLCSVLS